MSSGGDTGKGLVDFFSGKDNHVFIEQNSKDKNTNKGSKVKMSPKMRGNKVPTEDGAKQSPFYIALGHEIAHAQDRYLRGNDVDNQWLNVGGVTIRDSEKYATHVENQLRAENGLSLRTHYAINRDGTGYNPSRILTPGGSSMYFTRKVRSLEFKMINGLTPQGVLKTIYKPFKYK